VELVALHPQTDQPEEPQVLVQPFRQRVGLGERLGRLQQARPDQPEAQAALVELQQVAIQIKPAAQAARVAMVEQAPQAVAGRAAVVVVAAAVA
jgi:hypothetical protein